MCRVALLFAAVAAAFSQETPELFKKAPPGVEDALRLRITEFYQYHVDGRFRLAEKLVADDTKDFFFTAGKPRYLSFEINKIEYSDDFTKARVILLCEQQVLMPGVGAQVFKVPTPSRWKLDDGKWCWYVDLADMQKTPWGVSNVNPLAKGTDRPAAGGLPQMPGAAELQGLLTAVKTDKASVEMKEVGDEAEVRITNGVPGAVNLVVPDNPMGLAASIAKAQLVKGESTVLRLKRLAGSRAGTMTVTVEPTNQVIPIQVILPEIKPAARELPAKPTAVTADKSKVELKKVGAVAEVRITNGVPGAVKLIVPARPMGLTASLAKAKLAEGESTVLRLKRVAGSKAGTVKVTVEPAGQVIEIQVAFR